MLKQFGFTGDLYSESVLNSALRKLPPELKTKWFSLGRAKATTKLIFANLVNG